MFQILGTIILVISLFLAAGGITTFAARASLPDGPLYTLKLWSEEARLNLADPQQDWQLALEFAERRGAEIRQMVGNGQVPPESLQIRLRQQVEQAIQLAIGRQDDDARRALEQIRLRLENQVRLMLELQGDHDPQAEAALIRARHTLQERQRWVEFGIQEPNWLRNQFRLRLLAPEYSPGAQEQWRHGTPQSGGKNQSDNDWCPNCTSQGDQAGGNPWTTGTPTPGSGYGEGQGSNPWTTGTPTPGSGYGGGQGSNPWATGTPTPGSGYGPGPGPCSAITCTPEGNNGSGSKPTDQPRTGYGSQPTQTSPTGGDQPDQGGLNPHATSKPKNGGKP